MSTGIVNVSASKIEIALDCREAKILSGDDRAFHAEKISVGTYALLDGGFLRVETRTSWAQTWEVD